jgi:hypothetical protein
MPLFDPSNPRTNRTEQSGQHAADHNAVAVELNKIDSVEGVGLPDPPDPREPDVPYALAKKSNADYDIHWKIFRGTPDGASADDVLNATGDIHESAWEDKQLGDGVGIGQGQLEEDMISFHSVDPTNADDKRHRHIWIVW